MMQDDEQLFELGQDQQFRFELIGGAVPVIMIDGVYARPDDIREMALQLRYSAPPYPYPGKLAVPPKSPSLDKLVAWAMDLVNRRYLPNVPPIANAGSTIAAFRRLHTDFGIVDIHPDELSDQQRIPHVDPVPIFGLVYLNREERGGTMFFEPVRGASGEQPGSGYVTGAGSGFRPLARIEGVFNRLAVYPGFIPHSGEIRGDWIESEQRFASPRLTQRLVFFP